MLKKAGRRKAADTNALRLTARGVRICISPWNCPLAIGDMVLAKPVDALQLRSAQPKSGMLATLPS